MKMIPLVIHIEETDLYETFLKVLDDISSNSYMTYVIESNKIVLVLKNWFSYRRFVKRMHKNKITLLIDRETNVSTVVKN